MPPDDTRSSDARLILSAAIERLRDDRAHGASWLARSAAAALGEAAMEPEHPATRGDATGRAAQIRRLARDLAYARPSMAAVANTVARIVSAGWPAGASPAHESDADAADALGRVRQEAERLVAQWETAASAITSHARALVTPPVFTHSRSGTVESVLTTFAHDGMAGLLTVTRSHPGEEGVMTAHTLAAAGWGVTLVEDSAAGLMMDQMNQAGCVVLGADSIRHDGSLVNKVGSYLVALAARAAGVPVYALCETLKIAAPGWPLALEEPAPLDLPNLGVATPNIIFDQTPAGLITAIVTERGPLSQAEIAALAMRAEERLAALAP